MGHKRKHIRETESEQSSSDQMSSSSSSESESSQSEKQYNRLSKRDLKKLITLEKKIQDEERLLRKLKQKQSKVSKKERQVERVQVEKEQRTSPSEIITQGKKLFITGIDNTYTFEEVTQQLNKALDKIDGVTGFRIKMKEGCPTYAFIDFESKQSARDGIERLRKKKIFNGKIAIYYSQDEHKENSKGKKCFQCKGYGHFARECQFKRTKEDNLQQKTNSDTQYSNAPAEEVKQEPVIKQQKTVSMRIVRDKSRASRLLAFT